MMTMAAVGGILLPMVSFDDARVAGDLPEVTEGERHPTRTQGPLIDPAVPRFARVHQALPVSETLPGLVLLLGS
jgi:hypothetical protein